MTQSIREVAAAVGAALRCGDRLALVRNTKLLVMAHAPLTSGWKQLAQPLLDYGEVELARLAMDRFADAHPFQPSAQFDRALVYAQTGAVLTARQILDDLSPDTPDPTANGYLRGTIALNMGDMDIARAELMRAHRTRPSAGQIVQSLSMVGSLAADEELAELVVSLAPSMAGAIDSDRAPFLYALGKTWMDLGRPELAFESFSTGAAIVRRQRSYRPNVDTAFARVSVEGWSADLIRQIGDRVRQSSGRAIIVTGLPRSGSTLVEQILASHSQVSDGAELGRFGIVAHEVGGIEASVVKRWAQENDPTIATRTYCHLLAQRFGPHGRIVDKTLDASRYLGLLASIIPQAPIVWIRRRPLDTAWSCFSTWFTEGVGWSWSLEDIAAHMRLEEQLLEKWQDILRDRLLVLNYEALVTDKASVIPRVLQHVGLPPEPAVMYPERAQRIVATASAAQVRVPINSNAIGKAKVLADHLGPFIDRYTKLGGRLDE